MSFTLLETIRGDQVVFEVSLLDADGVSPLNLAGLGLTFTADRAGVVITKTIGDGIVVTDEAGGVAQITLLAADTVDLEDRIEMLWDLQVSNGTAIITPLEGRLLIVPDVSP